jgi:hypothetical protein
MEQSLQRLLLQKIELSRTWKASIKFVCWQIWLARNKLIFKEKLTFPSIVVAHAIGQMGEYLTSRRFKVMADNHLEKEEEKWMKKINLTSIHPQKRHKNHAGSFNYLTRISIFG